MDLRGVRPGRLAGELAPAVAQTGLEALVGLGWLTVALVTFGWFVRHGRRQGTLEFGV